MTGKQAFDKKVANLQSLAETGKSAETTEALRRALKDRSNFVVSKAADLCRKLACSELIPDLGVAFDRFLPDGAKADPQCWAKNAIARTLVGFDHPDSDLYLRGLRHFQPEPVFGGYQDTAATLRGTCAHALILCRDLSELTILRHLVDLLADPEPPARIEAVRAIAQLGRQEGALVLRTKIYCGDNRDDVIGHTMGALLALEPRDSIAVVAKFLGHANEDLRFEAAAALGECRDPEALETLRAHYQMARDPRWRRALLVSIGASLQQDAIDFLISLITSDNTRDASDAITALEPVRFREEQRARIESAVRQTDSDVLLQTFRKTFGA